MLTDYNQRQWRWWPHARFNLMRSSLLSLAPQLPKDPFLETPFPSFLIRFAYSRLLSRQLFLPHSFTLSTCMRARCHCWLPASHDFFCLWYPWRVMARCISGPDLPHEPEWILEMEQGEKTRSVLLLFVITSLSGFVDSASGSTGRW